MSSFSAFFLSPKAIHPVRSRPAEGTATAATGRPASNGVHDERVTITDGDVVRQMRKVLRLAVGDSFIALDGNGQEYACVIDRFDTGKVFAHVQSVVKNTRETTIPIHCYPALIKRERFAFLLEKCTELGAASYTPIVAHRSPYADVTPHTSERWERIIREAAEVARRGILPALHPVRSITVTLQSLPSDARCFVLSTQSNGAHHASELVKLLHGAASVHLFIGPEGDYTSDEYALFAEQGAIPFSLGSRIVRSETAAIAAVALITSFL